MINILSDKFQRDVLNVLNEFIGCFFKEKIILRYETKISF